MPYNRHMPEKITLPPLSTRPRPVLLAILDGWGCRDNGDDNAIARATTPNWDYFSANFPSGTLSASALDVGLPQGQMGNSEVGHMNIGAGRVVLQDLPRIDAAVADGTLQQNPQLRDFIAKLKTSGGACHLLGLLSDGGVHAHQNHIIHLAKTVAEAGIPVWLHAFLDGRDTPPKSAKNFIMQAQAALDGTKGIRWASVSGRYFAMDRDKRWERVECAYDSLVRATGEQAASPLEAVEAAYVQDKTDEFVPPTALDGYPGMQEGDGVLMANFRADRAREILTALLDPGFDGFVRKQTISFAATLGMVEYSTELAPLIPAMFPPEAISHTLGEVVANAGMRQLRIAETEKYAHVTFFFNAGQETEFPGEKRILIPSPKVATYDLQPEMSAYEVTEALENAITSDAFDLIVVNYANPDMVGHTGNMEAAVKAVETVDTCLGRLASALLPKGGMMFVTADHGNIEQMEDHATHQAHTAHTLNLVPFLAVCRDWEGKAAPLPQGKLSDIAPTLLQILGVPQPEAMSGTSRLSGILEKSDA